MKASFKIRYGELIALGILASKDESRYVIQGIFCEITKEQVILVATDGKRMGILKSEATEIRLDTEKVEFSFPPKLHDGTGWKHEINQDVNVKYEDGIIIVEECITKASFSLTAVDGYPDFRQVPPNEELVPWTSGAVDCRFIADLATILEGLNVVKSGAIRVFTPKAAPDEHRPLLIKSEAWRLVYVVMPMRSTEKDAAEYMLPEFLGIKSEARKAAILKRQQEEQERKRHQLERELEREKSYLEAKNASIAKLEAELAALPPAPTTTAPAPEVAAQ